ncbi:YcxB family protein [Kordia sp.]|uniref:YcxB family protein n=1 Tax=Kordia sp. TaxID=1965332 RepID=UPI003B5B584F
MIDTKTYHLTKKTYRNIFFSKLKRNILQLIPFLLFLTLLIGWQATRFIALYSVCALILIGFCILLWFYFKNLKPFFTETQLKFNEQEFQLTKNDGTSTWLFSSIRNVVVHEEYWLIYLTINSYLYVPKNIFYTEEDFNKFKALLNV